MINLIIPFLGFVSEVRDFWLKFYMYLPSVMRSTHSAHLISLISSLMMYDEEYKSWNTSTYSVVSIHLFFLPLESAYPFPHIYHLRDSAFKPPRMDEMFIIIIIIIIIIFMITIIVSGLICGLFLADVISRKRGEFRFCIKFNNGK